MDIIYTFYTRPPLNQQQATWPSQARDRLEAYQYHLAGKAIQHRADAPWIHQCLGRAAPAGHQGSITITWMNYHKFVDANPRLGPQALMNATEDIGLRNTNGWPSEHVGFAISAWSWGSRAPDSLGSQLHWRLIGCASPPWWPIRHMLVELTQWFVCYTYIYIYCASSLVLNKVMILWEIYQFS